MVKLLVLLLAIGLQDDPIAPQDAADHVGEDVTVKMIAESTRLLKDRDLCFLNSKKDHRDDDNFTVVIRAEGLMALAEAEIEDPADHFKGKTILVTGRMIKFNGKPQIEVRKADQIELVEDEDEAEMEEAEAEAESEQESDTDDSDSSDDGDGQ